MGTGCHVTRRLTPSARSDLTSKAGRVSGDRSTQSSLDNDLTNCAQGRNEAFINTLNKEAGRACGVVNTRTCWDGGTSREGWKLSPLPEL